MITRQQLMTAFSNEIRDDDTSIYYHNLAQNRLSVPADFLEGLLKFAEDAHYWGTGIRVSEIGFFEIKDCKVSP